AGGAAGATSQGEQSRNPKRGAAGERTDPGASGPGTRSESTSPPGGPAGATGKGECPQRSRRPQASNGRVGTYTVCRARNQRGTEKPYRPDPHFAGLEVAGTVPPCEASSRCRA